MKTDASPCSVRDGVLDVPYIKTIYETSRRLSPTSRQFTGRRGRRPLHQDNLWDVEDAVSYNRTTYGTSRTPSPTSK